jgi:hypothetical protein
LRVESTELRVRSVKPAGRSDFAWSIKLKKAVAKEAELKMRSVKLLKAVNLDFTGLRLHRAPPTVVVVVVV